MFRNCSHFFYFNVMPVTSAPRWLRVEFVPFTVHLNLITWQWTVARVSHGKWITHVVFIPVIAMKCMYVWRCWRKAAEDDGQQYIANHKTAAKGNRVEINYMLGSSNWYPAQHEDAWSSGNHIRKAGPQEKEQFENTRNATNTRFMICLNKSVSLNVY